MEQITQNPKNPTRAELAREIDAIYASWGQIENEKLLDLQEQVDKLLSIPNLKKAQLVELCRLQDRINMELMIRVYKNARLATAAMDDLFREKQVTDQLGLIALSRSGNTTVDID